MRKSGKLKLMVNTPWSHAQSVCQALSEAGAGQIGNYSHCAFFIPGTGTFRGNAGSNPAIGQSERLETVSEARLEMVLDAAIAPQVLKALRESHPYEEIPLELVELIDPEQFNNS